MSTDQQGGQRRLARCVLHIGTPKTGTSTIQAFLHENRDALKDDGYIVPRHLGGMVHRLLVDYVLGASSTKRKKRKPRADEALKTLVPRRIANELAEAPDAHTLLLSTEHAFSRLSEPAELAKLKDLLLRYAEDITVLVYLRPQHEYAISLFSTAVKSNAKTLEMLPEEDSRFSDRILYDRVLAMWEEQFPDLRVRLFNRPELIGEDIVADYCAQVGLDVGAYEAVESRNVSLDAVGQAFLLEVNRHIPNRLDRRRLIDYVYRTRQGQGLHPSPEEVHAFMARFAESNEAVRAKYFPERKTLFDIKAKPAVSAELTKDDIFGIFSGFIVEERARVRDRRGGSDDDEDEDDDDYDRDAED